MAVATKLKFVWCFQCIIWWQLLGKWNQLLYLCEKNKQINCFKHFSCHKMMYLFVQLLHIETGWVIKGVNSESGKIQTPESRSSKFKLNHARNFFKGVHQCQTDIVQEAGLFAPSLASFDETIETFWKCQLPCLSPVPVLCAINVFKRQFLLWFCKIRRLVLVFLPGSWMCLCWDWGHWRCAALQAGGIVVAAAARRPESASSFDLVWIFYSALCARSFARDSEVLACCCGSNIEFGTESELWASCNEHCSNLYVSDRSKVLIGGAVTGMSVLYHLNRAVTFKCLGVPATNHYTAGQCRHRHCIRCYITHNLVLSNIYYVLGYITILM